MNNSRRIEMLDNLLKSALADEMPMGMYLSVSSVPMVEIAAQLGVKWIIVNMEHGAIESWPEARTVAKACDSADIPFIVKLEHWSPEGAHHGLDLGAIGILVPKIKDAAELRMMSKAIKFPPFGDRGYCPVSKANNWGSEWVNGDFGKEFEAYWEFARRALIIPMLETREAVDNIDEILEVDECPIVFPGTADLGVAFSSDGRFNMDEKKRVDVIVSGKIKAKKNKILLHTHHPERAESESVGRLLDLGVRMPALVDLWAFGGAVLTGSRHASVAGAKRREGK